MKNLSFLFREPYRLFFPLGCFIGLLGVGYWVLFAFRFISDYLPAVHSALQMQGFVHTFILGFLMTAVPRLTGSVVAQPGEVVHLFFCLVLEAVLLVTNHLFEAQMIFGWTLIALLIFLIQRVQRRKTGALPPSEFLWLPWGWSTAVTGVLIILGIHQNWISSDWGGVAKKMMEQGWAFAVIAGVGGFLAPRLMGTFRAPDKQNPARAQRQKAIFHFCLAVIFYVSFWIEKVSYAGVLIRASAVTATLIYSLNFFAWPRVSDFYARMIWFSFVFFILGILIGAIFPVYATLALHASVIGGVALMIFAVASMVVLTHQGQPEKLHKPLLILRVLAGATLWSLVIRIAAFFDPAHYFLGMGIAGIIWSFAVFVWFLWMLPKVTQSVSSELIERQHEQAKQRISALR